jgi:hypothetical protein
MGELEQSERKNLPHVQPKLTGIWSSRFAPLTSSLSPTLPSQAQKERPKSLNLCTYRVCVCHMLIYDLKMALKNPTPCPWPGSVSQILSWGPCPL